MLGPQPPAALSGVHSQARDAAGRSLGRDADPMTVNLLVALLAAPWLLAAGAAGQAPGTVGPPPVLPVRILAGFDPPAERWLPGHRGVDLAAVPGQSVTSPVHGTVIFAGSVAGTPVVSILLADSQRVTFQPVRSARSVGDAVVPGALVGTIADSEDAPGHCSRPPTCLHLGLRKGTEYRDPRILFQGFPVLKPAVTP